MERQGEVLTLLPASAAAPPDDLTSAALAPAAGQPRANGLHTMDYGAGGRAALTSTQQKFLDASEASALPDADPQTVASALSSGEGHAGPSGLASATASPSGEAVSGRSGAHTGGALAAGRSGASVSEEGVAAVGTADPGSQTTDLSRLSAFAQQAATAFPEEEEAAAGSGNAHDARLKGAELSTRTTSDATNASSDSLGRRDSAKSWQRSIHNVNRAISVSNRVGVALAAA